MRGDTFDAAREDAWGVAIITYALARGCTPWYEATAEDANYKWFAEHHTFDANRKPPTAVLPDKLRHLLAQALDSSPQKRPSLDEFTRRFRRIDLSIDSTVSSRPLSKSGSRLAPSLDSSPPSSPGPSNVRSCPHPYSASFWTFNPPHTSRSPQRPSDRHCSELTRVRIPSRITFVAESLLMQYWWYHLLPARRGEGSSGREVTGKLCCCVMMEEEFGDVMM